MRHLLAFCLALSFAFFAGCGKDKSDKEKSGDKSSDKSGDNTGETFEALMKANLALKNDYADLLEKITAKDDVAKHKDDLDKIAKRVGEMRDRATKVGPPTTKEDNDKMRAYQARFDDAEKRYKAALKKLPADAREAVEAFNINVD